MVRFCTYSPSWLRSAQAALAASVPANLYRFVLSHTFTGTVTRKCGAQLRPGPTTSTHQAVQICSLPVKAAPSKPAPAGALVQMLNGLKGYYYQQHSVAGAPIH